MEISTSLNAGDSFIRFDSPAVMSEGIDSQYECTQTEAAMDGPSGSPGASGEETRRFAVQEEPKHYARLISLCPDEEERQLMRAHAGVHSGYEEREAVYTLGRGSKCNFRYADCHVSTLHARIFCVRNQVTMDMDVYIEDVSNNGTYVQTSDALSGAQKLVKGVPRQLRTGDEVFLVNPTRGEPVRQAQPEPAADRRILDWRSRSRLENKKAAFLVVLSHGHFRHLAMRQNVPTSSANIPSAEAVEYLQNSQDYAQQYKAKHHFKVGTDAESSSQSSVNSRGNCSVQSLLQKQRSIHDYYTISTDVLGTGSYATVREARRKNDGSTWAVKIISTRSLESANCALILREAEMLRLLRHRCIISLEDVFEDSKNLYLVMEMCIGGDLFDRIISSPSGRYSEENARQCMRNILDGLSYLHSHDVAHRDIKPENILLTSRHDDVNIKISDFGLAKRVDESSRLRSIVGTPVYYAPEVMQRLGTVKGLGEYSVEADMWSVGVLLYAMLFGRLPWQLEDVQAYELCAERGQHVNRTEAFPQDLVKLISPLALDLMQKLLVEQPRLRLTAQQALSHPWIAVQAEALQQQVISAVVTNPEKYPDSSLSEENKVCDMEVVRRPTVSSAAVSSHVLSDKQDGQSEGKYEPEARDSPPPESLVSAPPHFPNRGTATKSASSRRASQKVVLVNRSTTRSLRSAAKAAPVSHKIFTQPDGPRKRTRQHLELVSQQHEEPGEFGKKRKTTALR